MRNKKSLFAIVGLTAVLVGGTTLAYFTQSTSVENNFATKKYGSTVTETFTPDDSWQPGTTTTKEVGVTNTGDYDVLARASWTETWTRDGEEINLGESVVTKSINTENWLVDKDGYYYYNAVLKPGEASGPFLNSVTLDEDADMGTYITTYNYTFNDGTTETFAAKMEPTNPRYTSITELEVVKTLDPASSGYANAEYKLTITIDVVQANRDAIIATWNTMTTEMSEKVLGLLIEVK